VLRVRNSVIRSIKAGLKREALRSVKSMKLLQLSRNQCAGSMDKIDHVLRLISDAETTKKVFLSNSRTTLPVKVQVPLRINLTEKNRDSAVSSYSVHFCK
jgi:hypothetical protein